MSATMTETQSTGRTGYDPSSVSPFQRRRLEAAGIEVPATYAEAQAVIDAMEPTENQLAKCAELGLATPGSFGEAMRLLNGYSEANPEWAKAERAARQAKGRETRAANRAERLATGQEPEFDVKIEEYYDAAVRRWGQHPMEIPATRRTIAKLRQVARALPQDSQLRIDAFLAMKHGISQSAASKRIQDMDRKAA